VEDVILSEVIRGQTADGTDIDIIIEIGAPYPHPTHPNEWVCLLEAPSLRRPNYRIHAGSALQALGLAMSSLRTAMIQFREDGGKMGFEIGQDDYDINSTFGITEIAGNP
jgi:hypothetical protein